MTERHDALHFRTTNVLHNAVRGDLKATYRTEDGEDEDLHLTLNDDTYPYSSRPCTCQGAG